MQLSVIEQPRQHEEIFTNCWLLVDLLSLRTQRWLLESCRVWGKGRLKTWETSPGKPMNHPFFCIGHNWKPYEYYKGDGRYALFNRARAITNTRRDSCKCAVYYSRAIMLSCVCKVPSNLINF